MIVNPLPQRFLTDDAGIGGVIKQRPEDFLVDEQPLYEPCGRGEHLYLGIEKAGVAHAELLSLLQRNYQVPDRAIGFAGMKDKLAITRQVVSIHLPHGTKAAPELGHERVRVLWSTWHTNKLRRGHLAGNRFSIRIRNIDPLKVPQVRRKLAQLESAGLPNYFGFQRFGYRRNNHLIGCMILNRDFEGVVRELLGADGAPFPEYQRERRERFDAGDIAGAAALWTPSDRAELMISRALARGRTPDDAVHVVGHAPITFWISAAQSAMFNRVLDRRLSDGLFESLVVGDIACRRSGRGLLHITENELADPDVMSRVANLELTASGPLWGPGMPQPREPLASIEREALDASGLTLDDFSRHDSQGARRPLRVPVRHVELDAGVDQHGPYIRIAFDLPRGVYATVLLREVMKVDEISVGDARESDDDGT
jgi:tRNA pseudouridine13 synthase